MQLYRFHDLFGGEVLTYRVLVREGAKWMQLDNPEEAGRKANDLGRALVAEYQATGGILEQGSLAFEEE